jgi:hypothetical protein
MLETLIANSTSLFRVSETHHSIAQVITMLSMFPYYVLQGTAISASSAKTFHTAELVKALVHVHYRQTVKIRRLILVTTAKTGPS